MNTELPKVRLILVDDHAMVLAGLRTIFERANHIAIVGEAKDGLEALELIRELDPDVALVDLKMPRMNGQRLIEELQRMRSRTLPIVLTSYDEPERMLIAKQAGARGYLCKDASQEQLINAVERVARGETHFPGCPKGDPVKLTPRELEVAILIAKGFSSAEITKLLGILLSTVGTHRGNILFKIGAQNTAEVTRWVIDSGVLDEEEPSSRGRQVAE